MGLFSSDSPSKDSGTPTADLERLQQLKKLVSLGIRQFERVGLALEEIRDRELFRVESDSFERFCRDSWGMSERHAYRLIEAAKVCRELRPTGQVPETERQARSLATLPADQRTEAWQEAQAAAEPTGSVPASAVRAAVSKRKKKRKPTGSEIVKPISIRVPGCTVKLTPNGRFTSAEQALRDALAKLEGTASVSDRMAA